MHEITVYRQIVTVPPSAEMAMYRCPACRRDVNMLTISLAAKTAGVSPHTIYRWVEENRVHYRESSDGTVLICENSLRSI